MTKLSNPYKVDLVTIGVLQDNSNIIHAVARASDDEYKEMDEEGRKKFVKEVRRKIAKQLTLEQFESLPNAPPLIRKAATPKVAMLNYKLKLADTSEPFSDASTLALLSDAMDVNILVVDKAVKLHKSSPDPTSREKTVILYTSDNVHYQLIGEKDEDELTTVFDADSKLASSILRSK